MKICFTGSRYGLPEQQLDKLENVINKLIDEASGQLVEFFCSEYGIFERQARRIVSEIKKNRENVKSYWVSPFHLKKMFINDLAREEYEFRLAQFEEELKENPKLRDKEFKKFHSWALIKGLFTDEYASKIEFYDDIIVYELEKVPYKARIIESNKRKIDECDIVIAYCTPSSYQSEKIREYALKRHKRVINL